MNWRLQRPHRKIHVENRRVSFSSIYFEFAKTNLKNSRLQEICFAVIKLFFYRESYSARLVIIPESIRYKIEMFFIR